MGQTCVANQLPDEYNKNKPVYVKPVPKGENGTEEGANGDIGKEVPEPDVGEVVKEVEQQLG